MRPGLKKRLARGQAMVEYSFINFVVLMGAAGGGWVFWSTLMNALNSYFHSVYFVITSPVP
jgi:hypothetical protein